MMLTLFLFATSVTSIKVFFFNSTDDKPVHDNHIKQPYGACTIVNKNITCHRRRDTGNYGLSFILLLGEFTGARC